MNNKHSRNIEELAEWASQQNIDDILQLIDLHESSAAASPECYGCFMDCEFCVFRTERSDW